MAKADFPALLVPGMHQLTMPDLHALAVAPFPHDQRRADLYRKLSVWTNAVKAVGVSGKMWIDGSFLTEKVHPGDIDCVLWSPYWVDPAGATPQAQAQVSKLFDQATAEALYNLDFYLETPAPDQIFHREAYWRGILGFCHDRVTAKGFAEITL
ncbi:TPA: hypothetical protein QEM79_002283 [Pseudomonas putida]|uniref:DUF6932 family protein n=1 Tax=Pseudomonas urmiensis TaxID=2745493 RepID=UPI0032F2AC75|nr:hypothetical protein [Pseudomonas putida]HDS3808163.1 hypothetical protein [Pseudomonas putida]